MLTDINNDIVINKNASRIKSFYILQFAFFSLKFVGIVSVSSFYGFTISSQVIVESTIVLAKYFPFSQLHVAGFQI